MSAKPRGSLTKKPAWHYWAPVISAVGGIAMAGEVAAQSIAAASGHQLGHPAFGGLLNPIDGLRWLGALNNHCLIAERVAAMNPLHPKGLRPCATPAAVIAAIDERAGLWLGAGAASFAGFKIAAAWEKARGSFGRVLAPVRLTAGQPAKLVIKLGVSTGKLRALGLESGLARGQSVALVDDDVSQDLLMLGGKGSGKSTMGMNPIMLQAFLQSCGALIFNVKGNVDRQVLVLGAKAGRKVRAVGVGECAERFDLLAGVSPEMAATYISSLLLLTGNTGKDSTFWNINAANLSRAVLGLLQYFPEHYSLPGLYRYLFVEEYAKHINDDLVADLRADLEAAAQSAQGESLVLIERDLRYINGCIQEVVNFSKLTHEIMRGVQSQLSQILAKMVVPEMENAFGYQPLDGRERVTLEKLYEDGEIIVVNAPLQEYGLAAAAAMCFIKLRFYVTMEQRRLRKDCNQTRRVGLFIDECHEIAACSQEGQSDHKFLSMSRDTGTFCVLATQSVYALIAKVGEAMTRALLANLRQRIYLRSEDRWTIEDALYLLGTTEIDRESTSTTRDPGKWFPSKSTSHTRQREPIADASLMRYLQKGEALAILSIEGESADDVITMKPLFVNESDLA